ncbi:MAG TPA: SPOR domain-containing protein [Candidatus Binatia bacterium]
MKSTSASIDKEELRWALSWHPEGRCDSFTKGAILLFAPPISGVYGLFNFDCQVFIGESANIQEALLRHRSETDFQAQHLRPTGFTFEPCAAELRKSRADELIARFHPVLQTEAALTETWSASNDPGVSEAGLGGHEETYSHHQEFPLHEPEKRPKVRRHFYFKRPNGAVLAAMFVASVPIVFYLGMPVDSAIQKRANGMNPTSGQTEISSRPQNLSSIDTDGGLVNLNAEPTPAKPDVPASDSAVNIAARFATINTLAADREGIQLKRSPTAHSSGTANLSKKWSVQVSAAPAKDIAATVVQRLKSDGYDGYMVQAEVKGETYYRVRVGHFDSREKAESVRHSLTHQEGYRDAYLTGD